MVYAAAVYYVRGAMLRGDCFEIIQFIQAYCFETILMYI